MMKKIILKGVMVAALFCGCYEDKGNYDYKEVNEVTISGLPTGSTIISLGETVIFAPEVTFANPDDTSGFDYWWRDNSYELATGRVLEYTPTRLGSTTLEFFVKERSNGITYRASTAVSVNTPYKFGFAILAEKDNRTALHLIRRNYPAGTFTPLYDIYNKLYPDSPLGTGPTALVNCVAGQGDGLVIFQDENVSLNGQTLEKSAYMREEFPGEAYPAGVKPVLGAYQGMVDVLIGDNGKVYTRINTNTGIMHSAYFMTIPQYFDKPNTSVVKTMQINPYSNTIWMFDQANNRFVAMSSQSYISTSSTDAGATLTIKDESDPDKFSNLNGLGDFQLIYCGEPKEGYSGTRFTNILKGNDGKYYVQTFNIVRSGTELKVSNQLQREFKGTGIVTDNTVYEINNSGKYLFFAEGSSLYYCEFRTENDEEVQYVTKLHDFGKTITHLRRSFNSSAIGIAFATGDFYIMSVEDTVLGNPDPWSVGKIFESTENLGRIVEVIWKWGNSNNWIGNQSF